MADPLLECLLIACELAVRVDAQPLRDDGSFSATYASSGATLARRVRHAGYRSLQSSAASEPDAPAPHRWTVVVKAGGVRFTSYRVWVRESREEIEAILAAREEAAARRASLPHEQRRKKPWGVL